MFCEKCGNAVSETEKFCSKCGSPLQQSADKTTSPQEGSGSPKISLPNVDAQKAAEAASGTVSAAADGAKQIAGKGKEAWQKLNAKFGGGKMPIIAAAAAVVVVLVVVVAANGARLSNFFHKTFSSPEKYYQYVEKKTAKELSASAGDLYEAYVLNLLNVYDKSVNTEISIELGKDGREYLELAELAGVDLSWFKSITVKGSTSAKNGVNSAEASIAINKDNIISGSMILDTENIGLYVQIPELTKTYLGIDLGDFMSKSEKEMFEKTQEYNKALVNALPNQSKVNKLAQKYMNLAFKSIHNVSMNTRSETVEDISQKFTVLEVTIDDDTMQDMMKAVLEEMKDDKDIKKIVTDMAKVVNEDMAEEEVYGYFQDSIEDMLDNLQYYGLSSSEELVMKVYVDGKGNIKGRSFELKYNNGWGSGSSGKISTLMAEKGSKFGYELSVSGYGGESVKLTGSGKKSGDKISGDFKVKYKGIPLVDIGVSKFDLKKAKKGQLDGTFEISLSSKIGSLIGYVSGLSVIENVKLILDSDISGKSGKVSLGVEYDGDDLGKIVVSVKTGKGSKASIPGSKNVVMVEDNDDLVDWLETIEWKKVISKLEKTDLPSNVIDFIEDVADMLQDGDISNLWRLYRYLYY